MPVTNNAVDPVEPVRERRWRQAAYRPPGTSRIFIGIILFATGILGVQLFRLQIINQDQFREVSRGNALRDIRVVPARGAVYDRNGILMVHNEPTYTVTLHERYQTSRLFPQIDFGF